MISCPDRFEYITIPNGDIGISFTLSSSATLIRKQQSQSIPQAAVYGLIKSSQIIQLSPGLTEITISFEPQVLRWFLSESMHYLSDGEPVDLIDLFDRSSIERLHEQLSTAKDDKTILSCVEAFLASRRVVERSQPLLLQAYALITECKVRSVDELSKQLNVSGTALRTLFREHIGLSPKEIIKIKRIHEAMCYAHPEKSLTQLSYALGYTDQAHFIHEFKEMVGITPKKYLKNKSLSFDFYNFYRWQKHNFDQV